MRYIDIELYRWRFHNDIFINQTKHFRPDSLPRTSWHQYWKEFGAFVSVVPRQTGKSTMLTILANAIKNNEFELSGDYIIFCGCPNAAKDVFLRAGLDKRKVISILSSHVFNGIKHNNIHLMIDEFDFMNSQDLTGVLNYPWKSVTMVSTLK